MTEFRYRAYISYSHADERWAAWLQRALESYRVPARVLSQQTGKLQSRRMSPVFRDREDLSSGHSLTSSLLEALRVSEALIIVCSPAAAKSRWVNEEVRQFQALGRANRVLCMIVDGDPAAATGPEGCFPPALFDGVQDAIAEPLAADPRPFADGKKLAKLKLVAGLLGVRLDELRRRDLVRRRRWQAAGALAAAAAFALAAVTVTSRIAQQQQRVKAEQLAAFIVDLGEDLQSELDLESLGKISERAMAYLADLEPGNLGPETSIKVGLALRQLGLVNLGQGKSAASLGALERSRQLFRDLNRKHPDRQDVLFELGQSEFYVGMHYYESGEMDAVWDPWRNYLQVSTALYEGDPAERRWLLELSYASMNLMLLRILSAEPVDQELLDEVEKNVRLAERTVQSWPDNGEVLDHYSNTLAWAADAHYEACNLAEAGYYRQITLAQAELASEREPSNNTLRRSRAYRHSGMAMVLTGQGKLVEAEAHRLASLDILASLWAMDPSNMLLSIDVAANKRLLASLMGDTGREQAALSLMEEADQHLRPAKVPEHASEAQLDEYSKFLLEYAELLWRSDDSEGSMRALSELLDVLLARQQQDGAWSREERNRISQLRYLWWEIGGEDPGRRYPILKSFQHEADSPHRSCQDAELNAKLAIVSGNRELANRQVDYLAARRYQDPGYLHFCRQHGLCPP